MYTTFVHQRTTDLAHPSLRVRLTVAMATAALIGPVAGGISDLGTPRALVRIYLGHLPYSLFFTYRLLLC